MWVVSTSELITVEEAKGALEQAVPDLGRHLSDENIEILSGLEWYLEEDMFNLERVTSAWDAKLKRALALGYDGMRVSGDTLWLGEKDWKEFRAYERQLNDSITDRPMTVLCTYSLAKSGAAEILDVVQTHEFATARRQGEWEVIETPELIQAQAEIKRLNEKLEQRVIERTRELVAANEALKREIDQRMRVEEELRESAADLAEAQRVAKIGNWIFDLRTKKVTWSKELHRIFEIEKPDFDGRYESFVSHIHPDDQPQVLQRNTQTRINGSPFDIEYRIITPNSQVKIIREIGYAAQDEAGNVLRLFGTAQDITERKQAEDDLRRQKEILQRIFDHIPLMINFVDADGRIKLVNREWERTLGWSLEEIRQQNLDIFAETYPDPQYRQQVLKFVAEAKAEWADFKTRVRDGRVMDTTWVRVHLADGTSIGIGKDITERKKIEEALRESEERFRRYFELGLIGMAITSPDKGCLEVNDELCRILGYERSELLQMTWPEITHPDDLAAGVAQFDRVLAGQIDGYSLDKRWIRKDGRVIDSIMAARCVRRADGAVDYFVSLVLDTTERKQAEKKLKMSESQLAEAQQLAHVGSWDCDLRSDTVTWSDELYRIVGVQPGEIDPAHEAMSFVHPEDRDLVLSTFNGCVKDREPYSFYYRVLRRDGDERIVHSRGHTVSDEDGEPIRVFGTTQDVTELKRAEEKLKATSEQLRALSARLHSAREEEGARIARELHDELGSALTSLKWDLEGIDKFCSESGRIDASKLRVRLKGMMGLTDDTIDTVIRISSELRPGILDDLGLLAAIEWQAEQFEARSGIVCRIDSFVENIDLSREHATAVFRILQEAFTNILRHAKATRVNITVLVEALDFVLEIRDNGRGITEAESTGSRSLGLMGMRERVQLMGGRIEISGIPGKGTVLTLRIPIKELASD